MSYFKNKILLITGGTGSFGASMVNRLINTDIKEIRIFSRDEKKHDDMRKKYNSDKLKFYLGDVRDFSSLLIPLTNTNFIFHAAALKQVPSCEFYPMEAVKTNILGTENVLNAGIRNCVDKIICLSTDKAVYPINAMGTSKALMEKVALAKSRESGKTKISVTRYGNVMGSRGSVIPLFLNQIYNNQKITITNPNMTRFIMSLEEAVDLVLYAFKNGESGDIFVKKSPSVKIETLCEALLEVLNHKEFPRQIIGTRHGEKRYEVLVSKEEMLVAEEKNNFFKIPKDNRDLNYKKFFEIGNPQINFKENFNSDNCKILSVQEMKIKLLNLPIVKSYLNHQKRS